MPSTPSPSLDYAATRPGQAMPASRAEMLRTMLPHTMECLKARQANLIGDDLIEDYVTLDWLEWAGGGLRLTEIGRNLCSAMTRRPGGV